METRARKRTRSEKEEEGKRCIKTTLDNDKETHGCRRREDRQSTKERRRSEKVEAKSGGKREEGRRGAGGKLAMKVRERETLRTRRSVLAAEAARCCSIRAARPRRIRTAELWKWPCVTRQPPSPEEIASSNKHTAPCAPQCPSSSDAPQILG